MRFRFTTRDLLWLTLVVAMGFGWWIDHARLQSKIDAWPMPHIEIFEDSGK
jgi:hypothetical protein